MATIVFWIFLIMAISSIQASLQNFQNPINQFTIQFYKETSMLNPHQSSIMSPLSTQVLLGLLSTAARGKTQKQLFSALYMNDIDTITSKFKTKLKKINAIEGVILKIVNKIYVKDDKFYELAPNFKLIAEDSFESEVENIDFSLSARATNTINDWVETKTNHKIKGLVSKDLLNGDIRVLWINAIYFQGNWDMPFDIKLTSIQPFYINDSETIKVNMMYQKGYFLYLDSSELNSQILSLPYKSSNSSLIIILPEHQSDIKSVEEKIVSTNLNDLNKKMVYETITVSIPKFKISTQIDLKAVLPKLGMDLIFNQNATELDGILKNKDNLFISDAIQKSFIEVNEQGTEAAAASELFWEYKSFSEDIYFTANRPFLFALMNEEDIIFCGKFSGK